MSALLKCYVRDMRGNDSQRSAAYEQVEIAAEGLNKN
jgi:hypothetical protein